MDADTFDLYLERFALLSVVAAPLIGIAILWLLALRHKS